MATPTSINLSDTTPTAPAGRTNVNWEAGPPRADPNNPNVPVRDVSANMPLMTGDAGSGGSSGAVPAPTAGDATAGKYLKADGTWQVPPGGGGGGGSGTVTSVGLAAPPEFTVSGSPVTTSGTLMLAKANEPANQVYAGPSSGGPAAPGFRTLAAVDIPNIAESQVTGLTADLASKVPVARLVATTAPLTGGGDLTADRTLGINAFSGDSGSGGAKGAVPAPAAGDAAAGKFLKADGTWAMGAPASGSLVVGYDINTGAVGSNVGPMLVAPSGGTLSKCLVVTKASDGATALAFTIKKNGTSVFSASPSVAAGTPSGTVSTFTGLTSVPLSVAANDVFSCDVTAGTANWQFSAQLVT